MTPTERRDRRADIVDAAYRNFAQQGYERTSTAQICRSAGVSSGTFFHYFPTKASVLVAVLEDGLAHTREVLESIRQTAERDAQGALERWRDHVLEEASDDDLAGFVALVAGMPDTPDVAALLRDEATLVREVLTELATAGQAQGVVRDDRSPDRIAVWLGIVADGVLHHALDEGGVSPQLRTELADALARLVRPQ